MSRVTGFSFVVAFCLGLACGRPMPPAAPKEGDVCSQENDGACETATRLLACQGQKWVVFSDCKGAEGCRQVNDTVNCDTRGNGVGDRCSTPGRVRCDPDGGLQILRCTGSLVVEFSCPAQTRCVSGDAGLTCE
jgi:hypothetical protein